MSELLKMLRREIRTQGPISVARYMEMCLSHPQHGYYRKRDPFGKDGDFITAPEISQVFGELIGLWAGTVWRLIGRPQKLGLVEFGPGRGTLMSDALRAANAVPDFSHSIELHLVETSEPLRQAQHNTLADFSPVWHQNDTTLPDGPIIVIANEFFDALPIRQFERKETGWYERLIGLDSEENLDFILSSALLNDFLIPKRYRNSIIGTIVEICPTASDILIRISAAIARYGGAALIIDYGYDGGKTGDTLQAVRGHRYCSPLESPGDIDLTAHVNFGQLIDVVDPTLIRVHGPEPQFAFLERLGILERAKTLIQNADLSEKKQLELAVGRLINHDEMGTIFKAFAISRLDTALLPGFLKG